MVTLDDVARMACELPEVTEGRRYGHETWVVAGKAFAWTRPFSKADLKRFGATAPPTGPIIAVLVDDLGEKEAVLAAAPAGFFTIPHFNGYPAVLIQLEVATAQAVREALADGWLSCAPPSLAEAYLGRRPTRDDRQGPAARSLRRVRALERLAELGRAGDFDELPGKGEYRQ